MRDIGTEPVRSQYTFFPNEVLPQAIIKPRARAISGYPF